MSKSELEKSTQPLAADTQSPEENTFQFSWVALPGLIVFWVLMAVVFLQFFTRYVLNDSMGWTEEVSRFLLILVGFLGSVLCVRKGAHIFLEFFYRFVSVGAAKWLAVLAEAITIGFYSLMAWVGADLAMKTKQNMVSIPIPKSYIYWSVSLSFAAMAIFSLIWLVHKIRSSGSQLVSEIEERAISD
ncbi:TRAP transporter small permease [Marinomonas epiphytica]